MKEIVNALLFVLQGRNESGKGREGVHRQRLRQQVLLICDVSRSNRSGKTAYVDMNASWPFAFLARRRFISPTLAKYTYLDREACTAGAGWVEAEGFQDEERTMPGGRRGVTAARQRAHQA
jgi:hypothetical protein